MSSNNNFKLTLKNFKCFSNYSIVIDTESVILFDGPSGIGKSSLIQAFLFAITGEGKKLYKQGTKSLSVELEYNGDKHFKILRKKGPESLKLFEGDKIFDDDEAQARINNFFGQNFIATSVIKQKGENSFLTSSAKDKMVFLQSLLFSSSDIDKQKEKVREEIKYSKDKLNMYATKIKTLQEVLNSKHIETNICENLNLSKEECESEIKKINQKMSSYNSQVSNLISDIQKLQRSQTINSEKDLSFKQIQSRLCIHNDQLDNVNKDITEIEHSFDLNEYENLSEKIDNIRLQIKLSKLETRYQQSKKLLMDNMKNEITNIQTKLENIKEKETLYEYKESDYDNLNEKKNILQKLKETTKKLDECLFDDDEITEKKEKVKDIKSFLEQAELYKSSLTCPHCSLQVRYVNSALEKLDKISDEFTKENISRNKNELKDLEKTLEKQENNKKIYDHYKKQKNDFEKKLESVSHIKEESIRKLSEIIDSIDENRSVRRQLKKQLQSIQSDLANIECHPQIEKDFKELKKLKSNIVDSEEGIETIEKTNDLESKLSDLVVLQKDQSRMKDRLDLLIEKRRTISKEIKKIGMTDEECNEKITEIFVTLSKIDQQLKDMNDKLEKLNKEDNVSNWNEQINKISKYVTYIERQEEVKKIEKQIEETNEKYKDQEKDSVNLNILLEGIEYAESSMLSKFIDTINHNLSVHLEAFFDEPMHVQIKSFKEGKKDTEKPQINMDIFYKGNETDLSNLSGGEYDRLNLALTLTFNCISNSPILILDESLSSINQELSTEIIMHMKETISHKLVWMTQHQAVKGMFDKVYNIQIE